MARLFRFDYKSPYFYMVTLKAIKGMESFSGIGPEGIIENAITQAGGKIIILSPDGFGPRWHPPRIKERYCASGRMLFLSLYEADTRKCDNATLYHRCHEMGDVICAGLSSGSADIPRGAPA